MATYKALDFRSDQALGSARYVVPALLDSASPLDPGMRVLDVGCGNGALAGDLASRGCTVVGIDVSRQGIDIARAAYPELRFELLEASESVLRELGEDPFDLVVSTEVVEHLYSPNGWAQGCFAALRPGGRMVCSTPYHGYLKNVMLAVGGKFDWHMDPLTDGGHIKFWSRQTLSELLARAGFVELRFRGAGRLPLLWKSMVVAGDKPGH